MPHRRCRKSSALFLYGVLVLFFWQNTAYPVEGYWSNAAKVVLAQVQGNGVTENVTENGQEAGEFTDELKVECVVIERGETLWNLAQRYETTVEQLAALNGIESPDHIQAGQKLRIPTGQDISEATVVEVLIEDDDSQELLFAPSDLKTWEKGDGIQTIEIVVTDVVAEEPDSDAGLPQETVLNEAIVATPVEVAEVEELKAQTLNTAQANAIQVNNHITQTTSRGMTHTNVSQEDLELLARIIHAEARGEDFEGQVAVGAVVMNRVESAQFPNTIRGVVYQPRAFTAVDDNQIKLSPNEQAFEAAKAALAGEDPTQGALYYYNPKTATDKWIKTRPIVKEIGNHVFSI